MPSAGLACCLASVLIEYSQRTSTRTVDFSVNFYQLIAILPGLCEVQELCFCLGTEAPKPFVYEPFETAISAQVKPKNVLFLPDRLKMQNKVFVCTET